MERVLRLMAEKHASDVFLSANSPILIKIAGQMLQLSDQSLNEEQPRQLLAEVLTPLQLEELDDAGELNVSVLLPKVGNFRLSAFRQRGSIAGVLRCIPVTIPSLSDLNVPDVLSSLVLEKRGLILLVGSTGAGKSTTMAAMLEQRNQHMTGHILTLEDPIEFLFTNKKSVINQREVGRDTHSLQLGLKNALRQAPDCILIGEIRDRETMSLALSYALSGQLVLSTLHANNSYHALGRIMSFYPPDSRAALFSDLAAGLKAIVSQRLVQAIPSGRIPAVEVLQNTQSVSDLIQKGDFFSLKEAMDKSIEEGTQTFEKDLARLVVQGSISRGEALAFADSPTNLMWRLQNTAVPTEKAAASDVGDEEAVYTSFDVDVRPGEHNTNSGALNAN